MAGEKALRKLALLVGTFLTLVALHAQPTPAAAATSGTLFALVVSSKTIAKLDPATGALTTIANLSLPPGQPGPGFGTMAIDPSTHRLFVPRIAYSDFTFSSVHYQMITVNTQTGAMSISPDMGQGIGDLVFDTSSGTLYGHDNYCCPFHIWRIDPVTGALTNVAALPGVQQSLMAVAPSTHSIYLASEHFALGQPQPINTMLTLNAIAGNISESPPLNTGVFAVLYDTSSGAVLGKTFCCPAHFVQIDPTTGAETAIGNFNLGLTSGITIDSSTHTIFAAQVNLGAFGITTNIVSINDQTGAAVIDSTIPSGTDISGLAFEPVLITPESIKADVRNALASGAIDNAGVGTALLAELDAAAAARSRGQCGVAANLYNAFIADLEAQSGRHVAAATAAQLISEAQFLIANCP